MTALRVLRLAVLAVLLAAVATCAENAAEDTEHLQLIDEDEYDEDYGEEEEEEEEESVQYPPMLQMTTTMFDTEVATQGDDKVDWMLHLKTSWCERCEESQYGLEEAQHYYEGPADGGKITKFAEVDCGWYPSICKQFGPMTFPKVALVTGAERKVFLYEAEREASAEILEMVKYRGDGQKLLPRPGKLEQCGTSWINMLAMADNMMLNLEQYIEDFQAVEDPLLNAVLIGVFLGGLLVMPLLLINTVFGFLERQYAASNPPAARAKTKPTAGTGTEKKAEAAAKPTKNELDARDTTPTGNGPESRASKEAELAQKKLVL